MSLQYYLEENGIDEIEDDEEFCREEYEAIQNYCENYFITKEDVSVIESRGYDLSYFFDDYYYDDFLKELGNEGD